MVKNYDYRTTTSILSGGYAGEEIGVVPNDTAWHSTSNLSGSHTVTYYYRDSSTSQNSNSSRVDVVVRDDWTASIDGRNNLTVNVTSTIVSISRGNIQGNPTAGGTAGRSLFIRRYAGGPVLWSVTNDSIATAHTIATNVSLGTYTFTLEPGQNASRSIIYFRNNVTGHDNDTIPSAYVDVLSMGTEFRNPLPKDYRPGMILDANGVWQSHNRNGGWAGIMSGGVYREMRTQDGGAGQGNPPLIRHADGWYNQRLIGENQ